MIPRPLFVLFLLAGALRLGAASSAPPNILFVLTDDQGWPTLGCSGNRLVPTPHLDRLAADGARFTDAYVMPQCTPTRAALLTGQHTARTRLWHVIPWYGTPWAPVRESACAEQLPRDTFTFPKGLRAAGYTTGTAGKWHLTTNADGNYMGLKTEAALHYGFDFSAPPGPGSQNEGDKHVDYRTDLGEKTDLAAREPERAARLQSTLRTWIRSVGAEIPGANPHHDPTRPLKEARVKPAHLTTAPP